MSNPGAEIRIGNERARKEGRKEESKNARKRQYETARAFAASIFSGELLDDLEDVIRRRLTVSLLRK